MPQLTRIDPAEMDAFVLRKGANMQVVCVIDVFTDLQYDRQRIG